VQGRGQPLLREHLGRGGEQALAISLGVAAGLGPVFGHRSTYITYSYISCTDVLS